MLPHSVHGFLKRLGTNLCCFIKALLRHAADAALKREQGKVGHGVT
jgi:hypothetical protein